MRILLTEDDSMIGTAIAEGVKLAGFAVDWVHDGQSALLALETTEYALLILDLGLPKIDGIEVLRRIRAKRLTVPVLIITARDAVADRIAGLNLGADDYLTKPFDLDEMIARIRALLRRQVGQHHAQLVAGEICLDPIGRQVTLGNQYVHLSSKEFSLLEALMIKPGAVVSRDQLENQLYGWGEEIASNAIEVHLHNLRRKLGPEKILNVRGVGYKIACGE